MTRRTDCEGADCISQPAGSDVALSLPPRRAAEGAARWEYLAAQ